MSALWWLLGAKHTLSDPLSTIPSYERTSGSATMRSEHTRLLKKASRILAGLAAVIFCLGFVGVGAGNNAALPLIFLGLAVSVLATVAYLAFLRIAQKAAEHELEGLLTSRRLVEGDTKPVILFLRSFDVAKSGLAERIFAALRFLLFLPLEAWEPLMKDAARYDVDEKLDDAIGSRGLLVAIGNKEVSYGSAKLSVRDEDWKEVFRVLSGAAKLIVMLPGPSASVLWEISQLSSSKDALQKTVFVMPRHRSEEGVHTAAFVESYLRLTMPSLFVTARQGREEWAKTAALVLSNLSLKMPSYRKKGCYFKIDVEDHSISAVELEAFTNSLADYLAHTHRAADRSFDVGALWHVASQNGPAIVSSDATT